MHNEVGHLSDELGRVDTVRQILLQLAIARICEPVPDFLIVPSVLEHLRFPQTFQI